MCQTQWTAQFITDTEIKVVLCWKKENQPVYFFVAHPRLPSRASRLYAQTAAGISAHPCSTCTCTGPRGSSTQSSVPPPWPAAPPSHLLKVLARLLRLVGVSILSLSGDMTTKEERRLLGFWLMPSSSSPLSHLSWHPFFETFTLTSLIFETFYCLSPLLPGCSF